MQATLFVVPGSHPSMGVRLMLEHKGIDYRRVDLIPVISKAVLRAAGFKGTTVPALRLDGKRIQGSIAIARALESAAPEPPMMPTDPSRRAAVESAERWGEEVLQPIPRRILWNVLGRDPRGRQSYLEGARLGLPVGLAAKTAPPLIYLGRRLNAADDAAVQRDLADLPATLDHIDGLIADGVIGAEQPNVADFQIAPSVRLLMTIDDVRPLLDGRPCAELAMRLAPDYPGYAPAALPSEWKPAAARSAT